MSGRIGIDFGTSNSVVAVWDPATESAHAIDVPGLAVAKVTAGQTMTVIPSLVHYAPDDANVTWYGSQVLDRNVNDHPSTFRWMKRYIGDRASNPRRVGTRRISPLDAGRDFLTAVVTAALAELGASADEEIAFSVPVESFEHYDNWLREVAESLGVRRFRLIDESSAAALGYGAHIQPGDVYVVFDFGGGTLDVSVVRIDEEGQDVGRRCRVLGKAGASVGGSTIDSWLFEEVLRRSERRDSDEDVRRLSQELLLACEAAKEQLSESAEAVIAALDPESGRTLQATVTREELEELLDEKGVYTAITQALDRALLKANERGFGPDNVKQVLLVGGSSMIPSVQRTVRTKFGRDKVLLDRPLEAVALGAAAFVSGMDFFDHIQHTYAVRHVNAESGSYDFRTLVESGTSYPTEGPVASFTVKAIYDGQEELGLSIYELTEAVSSPGQATELVFDSSGAARMVSVSIDEAKERRNFWMNEQSPTFLPADPPASAGESRFQVEFHIDENKRLLVTARDLVANRWVYDRHPVVKLT